MPPKQAKKKANISSARLPSTTSIVATAKQNATTSATATATASPIISGSNNETTPPTSGASAASSATTSTSASSVASVSATTTNDTITADDDKRLTKSEQKATKAQKKAFEEKKELSRIAAKKAQRDVVKNVLGGIAAGHVGSEADKHFQRVSPNTLRIKRGFIPGMLTDGMIYANDVILETVLEELKEAMSGRMGSFIPSLTQVANVACLPGIVGYSCAMPDIHSGYGFAIGNVAATDAEGPLGVVSPGGVGFDINCGVRLLRTNLTEAQVQPKREELADALFARIPTGVGARGSSLNAKMLDAVLEKGLPFLVEQKLAWPEDARYCEEGGCMPGADPARVSKRAKKRGLPQAGTLGSGNHYAEVQVVDEIFDEKAAAAMGLVQGNVVVMIHSGSRGLGHQVCTDHLAVVEKAMDKQEIVLPDRQLACVRIHSPEGKAYLSAMAAAANFAFANRAIMTMHTRDVFSEVFGQTAEQLDMNVVYDVSHNVAKFETHKVNGKEQKVLVHRKGATRAFGPGHPDLPPKYKAIGQPILIGGSMGTSSWVMTGTQGAMDNTFGSTCHGAGRAMSRNAAKRNISSDRILDEMSKMGITLKAAASELIAEEAPETYKDVSQVIQTCHDAGISAKCARLRPIAVIKG